ncbi:MAG: transporter [Nitrospirae bacterium]|nr:transporter [Nitrospirota bacterium]
MKRSNRFVILLAAAITVAAAFIAPSGSLAASCCGGGSASTLVLPKLGQSEYSASLVKETYTGYWNDTGTWRNTGSDQNQYRLELGAAMRLAPRWQASISVPYAWNRYRSSATNSSTDGIGDTTIGIKYENFEHAMCITDIENWRDLLPAVYIGAAMTLPTGISPYDDVENSFGITGRGFYRMDGNLLIEKTIYPWNLSLDFSYGTSLERDVNREYGNYVEPYRKKLGDRFAAAVRFGWGYDLPWGGMTLTPAVSYSYVHEGKGEINGSQYETSGFSSRSVGASLSLGNFTNEWIGTLSWGHAIKKDNWGRNFPTTDTWMLGVSHVLYE